jgi:hypothetical protein
MQVVENEVMIFYDHWSVVLTLENSLIFQPLLFTRQKQATVTWWSSNHTLGVWHLNFVPFSLAI